MGIFNQNNSSSSGFSGRILVAIFIALVGFYMYMNQVELNPVTGEKQHVAITPSEEIKLGLESAPLMSRKMEGELSADDPRTKEVRTLGALIVSKTKAQKSPWKFRFHVLADKKTINAFALPGGQIFITEGLLDRLQDEAQLAGVLSHEMGHVIERHTAQQMAKSQLGNILVGAVAAASSHQNGMTNYSPAVIAAVVNHMFQLRYSRHDESEADLWGVKLMEEAGYDPKAMIQVLEILKASGDRGHTPEMFQTHPNPDIRIQQIKDYLEKHPAPKNLTEGKKLEFKY